MAPRNRQSQPQPDQKEVHFEELEKDLKGMGKAERIIYYDKKQGRWSKDARFCLNNREHGRLQVAHTGDDLVCCVKGCGYIEPLARL